MAITGTGTELDPFIVHSYDEMVEAFTCHTGDDTMYYSKLANDIDCNSYGSNWEWETVSMGSSSSTAADRYKNTLDLDGKTIKNIYIKSANELFNGGSYSNAVLKNGKILNIFGSSIASVFNAVTLNNISTSFQIGTPSGNPFHSCSINDAAIYAIVSNLGAKSLIFYAGRGDTVKNVDVYTELYNASGAQVNATVFYSTSSSSYVDSVRLVGKMVPADLSAPTKRGISTYKMINSVVDVDMSAYVFPDTSTGSINLFGTGDGTTVVNMSNINVSGYEMFKADNGYIKATSAQIKNGAALRELGFNVVNVGA